MIHEPKWHYLSDDEDDPRCFISCTCEWESPEMPDEYVAEVVFDEHVAQSDEHELGWPPPWL